MSWISHISIPLVWVDSNIFCLNLHFALIGWNAQNVTKNHLIQCIGSPRPVSVLNLLIQREAEPRCKEYFWWGIRLPVTCLGDASHFIAWVLKPKKGRSSSWSTSSSSSSPSFLPSGLGCFVYTCQALLERIRDWRPAKANSLSKSLVANVTSFTISDAVCLILTISCQKCSSILQKMKVRCSLMQPIKHRGEHDTHQRGLQPDCPVRQEERPSRPPALKSRPSVPRRVSWP